MLNFLRGWLIYKKWKFIISIVIPSPPFFSFSSPFPTATDGPMVQRPDGPMAMVRWSDGYPWIAMDGWMDGWWISGSVDGGWWMDQWMVDLMGGEYILPIRNVLRPANHTHLWGNKWVLDCHVCTLNTGAKLCWIRENQKIANSSVCLSSVLRGVGCQS